MKSSARITGIKLWKGATLFFLLILMLTGFYSFIRPQEKMHLAKESLSKPSHLAQLLDIPIHFEKNEGQIDTDFHYLARCPGHTFYFGAREVLMFLQGNTETLSTLKIQFVGANPRSLVNGIEEKAGKANYFIGNDPSQWQTNVPTYAKVVYQNLYPGIDAVFYGNAKQLEYDILVAPGMDPSQVRLKIEGAKTLNIVDNGDLHITHEDEQCVQMKKPLIYQMVDGKKIDILGEFVLLAKNEIGFSLSDYDASKSLVIDPILSYSTYLGGSGFDIGNNLAVDSSGNVYVTGWTTSPNFPHTTGSYHTGTQNIIVTKLDATGSNLIFSTYFGGSGTFNRGNGIAIDKAENVYITGFTNSSTNFPISPTAKQKVYGGGIRDGFVTKLDSTGSVLLYSTYLGGNGEDVCNSIAVDSIGNAYVTGYTSSANFPTTLGAFQAVKPPGSLANAFVTKLNDTGSDYLYSTYFGGVSATFGFSIVIDEIDNAYITGFTTSANLPVTSEAFQSNLKGSQNVFAASFNSMGSGLNACTYLGGTNFDNGYSIDIDNNRNMFITGLTKSSDFPVTGNAFQNVLNGVSNAFVTKINSNGSALIYSTFLGGDSNDYGTGIKVDNIGNAYITGSVNSSNFPVTSNAIQSSLPGFVNAFITKLNSSGSALIYSTYFGGSANDQPNAIALDSSANAYIVGTTNSLNFPTTPNAYQKTYGGGANDVFIAKLSIGNPTITSVAPNVGPVNGGTIVTITGTNFTNTEAVFFGTIPAVSFVVNNDKQITAVSPPFAAGIVDITVKTAFGTSATSPADQFTYQLFQTNTTLTVSPNPALVGQVVTLTAAVSPSTATGSVSFFDGESLVGTVSISNGTAVLTNSSFAAGTHSLKAIYNGSNIFASSTSEPVILTVNLIETKATLTVAPNPAKQDQPVTLTVSISPSSGTGTVSFYSNNQLLGITRVVNGQGILITSFAQAGKQLIVAAYSGDNQFSGSTTIVVTLEVGKARVPQPRKLTGFQKVHGFQTTNILNWKAPQHAESIVAYHVYRGDLKHHIGTVTNLENLRFKDANVKANKTYVYFVASIDEFDNMSKPAKVVIKGFSR